MEEGTVGVEGARAVERDLPEKVYSQQPRFDEPELIFGSVYEWLSGLDNEPIYASNSMKRDQWLRKTWRLEPHLAGVLNTVVSIDRNRGWSMVGGRNQVGRYTAIAHTAADGAGWRQYFGRGALSFYTTDLGFVSENGRDGQGGPLRALYYVDSARCRMTGNREVPLRYKPPRGKIQEWAADDYFMVTSMPGTDERFHGLGYCALSRCLELAKLMIAVLRHDQEKLGAQAPRGLLLLGNITQPQWDEAMEKRKETLRGEGWQHYGGVAVLAGGTGDIPTANLVALSQLPDGFDLKIFTDQLMYGYALAFGYDPSEFWPVQYGAMGRGRETDIQHRKATGKGGTEFPSGYQDRFQEELPPTLQFEFEDRDVEGEMLDAVLAAEITGWVTSLYESTEGRGIEGLSLLSREEARSLLAEKGLIPHEWTVLEEETETTDVERWLRMERERLIVMPRVRQAVEAYPDEPIVKYMYDPLRYPLGRELVLWPSGEVALRRKLWPVAKRREAEVLYDEDGVEITTEDVERAIHEAATRTDPILAELLKAKPLDEDEMDALADHPRNVFRRLVDAIAAQRVRP